MCIEIHGGKVEKLIHSRNKSGSAGNLELILTATDLLPPSIDISHSNVITGQKNLILYCEPPADTSSWDIVEIIQPETAPADETDPLPESAPAPDSKPNIDNTNKKTPFEMSAYAIAAVFLITVFLLVIIRIAISHQKKK